MYLLCHFVNYPLNDQENQKDAIFGIYELALAFLQVLIWPNPKNLNLELTFEWSKRHTLYSRFLLV